MKQLFKVFYMSTLWLTTIGAVSSPVGNSHKNNFDDIWFKGSIEEAFTFAKKVDKPVFIYWGATWCPPCDELKGQVFSKNKFRSLVKKVVPVYLDGDHKSAQIWGDRFNAAGYPTILLLTNEKVEVMRITSSVSIDEFEIAFNSGLASLKPFSESLSLALSGKAERSDWQRLSYSSSWSRIPGQTWKDGEIIEKMAQLQKKIPAGYLAEKSLLTANLLSKVSRITDKSDKASRKTAAKLKKIASSLFDVILKDSKSVFASRSTIAYETEEILGWAKKSVKSSDFKKIKSKWLKATDQIRNSAEASIDIRLWASTANYQIFKLENSESKKNLEKIPRNILKNLLASVDWAVKESKKSYYDRHSVISGAGWLLSELKEFNTARRVLQEELKATDTPWYYQSSLASLENKAGNIDASLRYRKAARLSSKGGATRLQWITGDLRATAKLLEKKDKTKNPRINEILNDFYKTSFGLKDGFVGRNKRNFKIIEKSIENIEKSPLIIASLKKYSSNCAALSEPTKKECNDHFKKLLLSKKSKNPTPSKK